MSPDQHLAHLLWLMSPPFTYHLWPHVKHRAAELAADAEIAHLPAAVEAEYQRLKAAAVSPKKPAEPPATA